MPVIRLVHIVFAVLLLAPPMSTVLTPPEQACEQSQDCCAPDGSCDDSCVACPCCPGPAPEVPAAVQADPLAAPPRPALAAPGSANLPLRTTDILHIPKSL